MTVSTLKSLMSFRYGKIVGQKSQIFEQSFCINPYVPNAPFLYPLKTENRKVFWCFQGVEKECIGNKWVKSHSEEVHKTLLESTRQTCQIKLLYCYII